MSPRFYSNLTLIPPRSEGTHQSKSHSASSNERQCKINSSRRNFSNSKFLQLLCFMQAWKYPELTSSSLTQVSLNFRNIWASRESKNSPSSWKATDLKPYSSYVASALNSHNSSWFTQFLILNFILPNTSLFYTLIFNLRALSLSITIHAIYPTHTLDL